MAYDPIRDRTTPTASPIGRLQSLPPATGQDGRPTSSSSGRYGNAAMHTPMGHAAYAPTSYSAGPAYTARERDREFLSPTAITPGGYAHSTSSASRDIGAHDRERERDKSYFSLPFSSPHGSYHSLPPAFGGHPSQHGQPPNRVPSPFFPGVGSPSYPDQHRDLPASHRTSASPAPTLAYPPSFSPRFRLHSLTGPEMVRNKSNDSGRMSAASASSSSSHGVGPTSMSSAGPGGPGMRSILNDGPPPMSHRNSTTSPGSRSSLSHTLGSQSAGPIDRRSQSIHPLETYGRVVQSSPAVPVYAHAQEGLGIHTGPRPGQERDRSISQPHQTPTPRSANGTVPLPPRANSLSLSMLLNDDSSARPAATESPASMLPPTPGYGTSNHHQQTVATPRTEEHRSASLAGKRSRSRSPQASVGWAGGHGMSPAGPDSLERPPIKQRKSSRPSSSHAVPSGTMMSPPPVPERQLSQPPTTPLVLPETVTGTFHADPAALKKWEEEKAKKKTLGKPRKDSAPAGPIPDEAADAKAPKVKQPKRRSTVAPISESSPAAAPAAELPPNDSAAPARRPSVNASTRPEIDLTFSPKMADAARTSISSEGTSAFPARKRSRLDSFTSSVGPSRRGSVAQPIDTAASPDAPPQEERWSPSGPAMPLPQSPPSVQHTGPPTASQSRRASGSASRKAFMSSDVLQPSISMITPPSQSVEAGVGALPATAINGRARPYKPTRRISPANSMLKPLSPGEAAYFTDPGRRRNTLLKQIFGGLVVGTNGHNSSQPEPVSGKRRRDSTDLADAPGAEPDWPEAVSKRQRDDTGRARTREDRYQQSDVAQHYNARRDRGVEARSESAIFGLRKFNNWVKSVMIRKFSRRVQDNLDRSRFDRNRSWRVLDLGCGKGGDIRKWDKAGIRDYIGIDIASGSIEDARERARSERLSYNARFYVLDCFNESITKVLREDETDPLFDNVSAQFCIHYAFSDVGRVRLMLENASRFLRKGGIFFGTTLSDWKILDKLAAIPEGDPLVIANQYYKIEFGEREHKGAFGHAYTFTLTDAIDDCKEYVVNWSEFESLASEYGFRCIYKKEFDTLFDEEQQDPNSRSLAEKMKVTRDGNMFMDEGEWEAATMYMGFAFEYTREPRKKP